MKKEVYFTVNEGMSEWKVNVCAFEVKYEFFHQLGNDLYIVWRGGVTGGLLMNEQDVRTYYLISIECEGEKFFYLILFRNNYKSCKIIDLRDIL